MGLRGIGARSLITPEILANREPHPWEKAKQEGKSRAECVAIFLETLPVSSGSLRGTKFKLRDWQWKEIIEPIYATDAEGRRKVQEAVISLPRKNGKTGLVAGLAACHLVGPESVGRGQVVSAANAKKQAGLIFNELEALVKRVPWMKERLNVQRFLKKMEDLGLTDSTYEALAAEAMTEYGLSASFWIYDELGQAKKRDLYDALSTSGGAWEESLGIVISTQAPISMHVMSELVDDGLQIREGIVDDPTRYACIYSAPTDADPWSEETWRACNPALGDFRLLKDLQGLAKKAQRVKSEESKFRNLYLNQRVARDVRFVGPAVWAACKENFTAESLYGQKCLGALDLSGTGRWDLTAKILLFEREDGTLPVLPFFWMAEERVEEAEARDRVPYRRWIEGGHLLTVPGSDFAYEAIARQMGEAIISKFEVQSVAADPYALEKFQAACEKVGIDLSLVKHAQGYVQMHPSIEALESYILSKKIRHNGNPVLAWCLDNVKLSTDSSGNRKFDKRKATGRIDGAQALAMACGLHASGIAEEASYVVTRI